MSVENVKAFIEKLNSDETFRNRITEASDDEARLNIARDAGYEFTVEEFNQSVVAQQDEELSEDQLEAVAGGAMQIFVKTWKASGPSSNLKWENIA